MPSRTFWLSCARRSRSTFWADFLSMPMRARSLAAAWASLRVGVGRPLPPGFSTWTGSVCCVEVRRNTLVTLLSGASYGRTLSLPARLGQDRRGTVGNDVSRPTVALVGWRQHGGRTERLRRAPAPD